MSERSAIVFGGTGLVGRAVIDELVKSPIYDTIRIFTRNKTEFVTSFKVKEFVIDFDHPDSFSELVRGDDIFICLGTTIKKAGSIKRMEEIDRDLPVTIAGLASENQVKRLAVVSSIGADASSSNYYLRIKGEMEDKISGFDFETIAIVRPSLLLGERKEKRFGESLAKFIMKESGILLFGKFRKYRAIEGRAVAMAMVQILNNTVGKAIYESDSLQQIADKK
jgi:uncharacterized protein YbjT (DUF2867 family)